MAVAVVAGSMVAVQSRLNGELSERLGSFPAAAVSFATGLALLSLLLVSRRFRAHLHQVPAAIAAHRLRWWQVLGGVGGGLLVSTQTYAVPIIGVAAFLVAVIGGQTASALIVDRRGWGPGPPIAVSRSRVVAALLSIAGVAVAAAAQARTSDEGVTVLAVAPIALAFAVGLAGSVQYALNGRVAAVTGDPFTTAWINFAVGLCAVLVLTLVPWARGRLALPQQWSAPWWAWLGGACGVAFIAGAAWAVQHTGVLVFGLVAVTSQTTVGVLLDLADPAMSARIGDQMLAGVAMTLGGALLAGVVARRPSPRR